MTIEQVKERFESELHITLSEKESQQFTGYQPHTVRSAMASTNRWLARKATMVPPIVIGRNGIVRSVLNTCLFRSGTAKPKVLNNFKPLAKRAEELRSHFQNECTNSGDWTITTPEAEEIIKRYGEDKAKAAMASLGRFGEDEQQECLDKLEWELSMVTL